MPIPVPALSHVQDVVATHLPDLLPAQQRRLALWVAGDGRARHPRPAAGVAVRRGRPRHPLRHQPGRGGVFRAAAGVGRDVVGRRGVAAGHRRHQPARSPGGARHQRALPGQRHPRGLVRAARPWQRHVAWPGCTFRCCAAGAGGGRCGCCRKPGRSPQQASPSFTMSPLQEAPMSNTSPSQPTHGETSWG